MIEFENWYAEHNRRLLAAATKMLGDEAAAQDICSMTRAKAWQRRLTYDPARGTGGAWLNCICRSVMNDYWRANRIKLLTLQESDEPEAPADDEPPDLAGALGGLPDDLAAAVRAVYLEDRTFAEAAEALGCSVGTVHKTDLARHQGDAQDSGGLGHSVAPLCESTRAYSAADVDARG